MEDREDEEDSVAATHNMNNEAGYQPSEEEIRAAINEEQVEKSESKRTVQQRVSGGIISKRVSQSRDENLLGSNVMECSMSSSNFVNESIAN
jgi:hypothetical protein